MKQIEMKKLNNVRNNLLRLHESLAHYQIAQYERVSGKINKSGQLYDLLASHPEFHWLRSLSGLIVSLDEFLDQIENVNESRDLIEYIKKLLKPDEEGNEFSQKYHDALQNSADVLVRHGKVMQSLKEI